MPEQRTLQRAQQDKRKGKAASTQAGEFIREEIHHIREGKHGARSAKQAIAIGLSKARRAGVELPPPSAATTSETTRTKAARDYERGHGAPARRAATPKRARASEQALKGEHRAAASHQALAKQTRSTARRRSPEKRSEAAIKASRTKGAVGRSAAARKAAQARASHVA
jgi:Family of unknown function (DUF6496)